MLLFLSLIEESPLPEPKTVLVEECFSTSAVGWVSSPYLVQRLVPATSTPSMELPVSAISPEKLSQRMDSPLVSLVSVFNSNLLSNKNAAYYTCFGFSLRLRMTRNHVLSLVSTFFGVQILISFWRN